MRLRTTRLEATLCERPKTIHKRVLNVYLLQVRHVQGLKTLLYQYVIILLLAAAALLRRRWGAGLLAGPTTQVLHDACGGTLDVPLL